MATNYQIELETYNSTGAAEIESKKNGNKYIIFYCYGKDISRRVRGNATTDIMVLAENVSVETDDGRLYGQGVYLDIVWSRNGSMANSVTVRQSTGK